MTARRHDGRPTSITLIARPHQFKYHSGEGDGAEHIHRVCLRGDQGHSQASTPSSGSRVHFPIEQTALKVLYLVIRTPRINRANVTGETGRWKDALKRPGAVLR